MQNNQEKLMQLLIADTTPELTAQYGTLVERANNLDFKALEDGVVVLDTETTGLSFKRCSLIEIAAVKLSGTQIVERFQTLVKPTEDIPEEIVKLTGISNGDVAHAPSQQEAVAALAEFVSGAPVLAHNATFDRTFIERVKGGHNVSDLWIDTLALSRIAFPRFKSHRLSDMADAFGCTSVAHRAMADVEALAGVWHILLTALLDLPEGMLSTFADMHSDVAWQYRPIFSYLAEETNDPEYCDLLVTRKRLFSARADKKKQDATEKIEPLVTPSEQEVMQAFSEDGLVAKMYDAYESRPEQLAMALEVNQAFGTSTHRVLEAGTGVGKSLAYLLPAALYAKQNNVCVGVATKTNTLSDQLVSRELPGLARVLPGGLKFAILKGYDHYPCLYKVKEALERPLPEPASSYQAKNPAAAQEDMLTALAVTMAYAAQSAEGDLDALGIRWRAVPRTMLTTTSEECLRVRCPFYPNFCFVHGGRKNADTCDVVVTNHSLLLRNIEVDGQILPPIKHWIVDEAHSFESEARRQWAHEVSARQVKAIFERLGTARTGAISTLMSQASNLEESTLVVGLLSKAAAEASRVQVLTATLFEAAHALQTFAPKSSGYETATIWINEDVRKSVEWQAILDVYQDLAPALADCCKHLKEATEVIAKTMEKPDADIGSDLRALIGLKESVDLIVNGDDKSFVYSAQIFNGRSGYGTEVLLAEKLDIGSELYEKWLSEAMSVVFCSATMAVGSDFSHFEHAVGLDLVPKNGKAARQMSSSFDFDQHMSAIVVQDLPAPGDPEYLEQLVEMLYGIHVAMGGSVLTLFTNRREMERAFKLLKPRLDEHGFELVMQERTQSAKQVRDTFLARRETSLLALKSFWEGFDAAGDTLRCVVIPRLPFGMPTEPLACERDLREDKAWWRYALPEAVISVKQAAGRLIRSANDIGVLVMADSRLVSKRYGKQFLKSLPTSTQVFLNTQDVEPYIVRWRRAHEKNDL